MRPLEAIIFFCLFGQVVLVPLSAATEQVQREEASNQGKSDDPVKPTTEQAQETAQNVHDETQEKYVEPENVHVETKEQVQENQIKQEPVYTENTEEKRQEHADQQQDSGQQQQHNPDDNYQTGNVQQQDQGVDNSWKEETVKQENFQEAQPVENQHVEQQGQKQSDEQWDSQEKPAGEYAENVEEPRRDDTQYAAEQQHEDYNKPQDQEYKSDTQYQQQEVQDDYKQQDNTQYQQQEVQDDYKQQDNTQYQQQEVQDDYKQQDNTQYQQQEVQDDYKQQDNTQYQQQEVQDDYKQQDNTQYQQQEVQDDYKQQDNTQGQENEWQDRETHQEYREEDQDRHQEYREEDQDRNYQQQGNQDDTQQQQDTKWEEPQQQQEPERTYEQEPAQEQYNDQQEYVETDRAQTQGEYVQEDTQQYDDRQHEQQYDDRQEYVEPEKHTEYNQEPQEDFIQQDPQQKEQWDTHAQDAQYQDDTQYQGGQQQEYEPDGSKLHPAGTDSPVYEQQGEEQYVDQVEPQVVEEVELLSPLPSQPNIIILLADGVREDDLGYHDHKITTTPNIDNIATKGVVLSHHIAGGLTDASSRAAFMTGRLPLRFGMSPIGDSDEIPTLASQSGLPPNETTFASLLQNAGYTTGFVGKWNLGMSCATSDDLCHHPNRHGFDSYFGMPLMNRFTIAAATTQDDVLRKPFLIMCIVMFLSIMLRKILGNFAVFVMVVAILALLGWSWFCLNNPHIWSNALMRNEDIVEQPVDFEDITERMVKEGARFLRKVKEDNKPFLLVMSWLQVNSDLKASKAFQGTTERESKIKELDWGVGEVVRALRVLGLDSNTLIYFTSAGQSPKAGGEDQEVTHASIPGVMQWSGVLPQALIFSEPTSQLDVTPTLARVAGGELPSDRLYDGQDLLPQLRSPGQGVRTRFMYHYCGGDLHAVRYTTETGRIYVGYLFSGVLEGDPFYCSRASSSSRIPTGQQEPLSIFDLGTDNNQSTAILPPHQLHDELQETLQTAIDKHKIELSTGENQFTWYKQSWHAYLQPKCASQGYTCKDENNALNDPDF